MAIERFYPEISPQPFIEDGRSNGIVKISDVYNFKVKMIVTIEADGFDPLNLEIKRILNKNEIVLGDIGKPIHNRRDMSQYVLAINPRISTAEQKRPEIPPVDYERAVYEEEPTVAKRVYNVDRYGDGYTIENPFPAQLSTGEEPAGYVEDALKVHVNNDSPIEVAIPLQDYDTFHRTRQSEPTTLWEFSFRYDLNFNRYWDTEVVGLGNIVHDPGLVSKVFTNGLNEGDKVTLRSRRYFQYYKGKSQLLLFTGNFKGTEPGVTKRMGYFDELNGVYMSVEDGVKYFTIRSNTSGIVTENKIPQSEWNLDKLDGTGASGLDIHYTNQQLMLIDFSWLGTNIVRYGFIVNGDIYYAHKENHSNTLTVPYMQSGSLPFCYEIENTSSQITPPSMHVTCGSVISEGGDIREGIINAYDSGTSTISVNTTRKIITAFRINPSFNRLSVKPLILDLLATSGNSEIYYQVVFNPTLVNDIWSPVYSGCMQYLSNYTSFSGGEVIETGYVKVGDRTAIGNLDSDIYFGRSISGNSDVIAIVVRTLNSTASSLYSIKWREFF